MYTYKLKNEDVKFVCRGRRDRMIVIYYL